MCEGCIRVVIVKIIICVVVVIRIGGNSFVLGWIFWMEVYGLLYDGRGGVVGVGWLVKDIVVFFYYGFWGFVVFVDSGWGYIVVVVIVVVVVGVRGFRVLFFVCV